METKQALIRQEDQKDILRLYQQFRRSRAKLVGPDGQTQSLPASLYDFLVQLIAHLAAGRSVSILQSQAQLTTLEAANMLGVSRGFLIKLVDRGDIPHHMVGTHRRIYVSDLLAYKARRDRRRHQALRELGQQEHAEGLYDLRPPDAESR